MTSDINAIADAFVRAVLKKAYGSPSSRNGKNPVGWHLDRQCTPTDASMHDNGIYDAIRAIRDEQAKLNGDENCRDGDARNVATKVLLP